MMLNPPPTEIEARLKRAGVSVDQFCREAGINRATWQRWKSEDLRPIHENWLRALATADRLAPVKRRRAAAE